MIRPLTALFDHPVWLSANGSPPFSSAGAAERALGPYSPRGPRFEPWSDWIITVASSYRPSALSIARYRETRLMAQPVWASYLRVSGAFHAGRYLHSSSRTYGSCGTRACRLHTRRRRPSSARPSWPSRPSKRQRTDVCLHRRTWVHGPHTTALPRKPLSERPDCGLR